MTGEEVLDVVRARCMAKPGVVEEHPWDDTAWKVHGKIFAMGGGSRVTVKATPDDQAVLTQQAAVSRAAYVGRFGWVTVEVTDQETLDLALELIDASFALVAHRRKGA